MVAFFNAKNGVSTYIHIALLLSTPLQESMDYSITLSDCALDTPSARTRLQRNEDKIEDFSKWSQNVVRFVKSILEEAESNKHCLKGIVAVTYALLFIF